jgi:tRNA nucleotidyltransferase (CCA-adding enzyme)
VATRRNMRGQGRFSFAAAERERRQRTRRADRSILRRYVVGGVVRDELLGRKVSDRDWVVVGETPESMVALGFRPVGRDFPVFLHPQTQEEHALARTERKSGKGYRGFTVHASPEVTLEEDLRRRDLTVNAMARGEDGVLVDPYGGERDLRAGVLRHVSDAFAEDPLRVLRVARFAAGLGFRVADDTLALMKRMVAEGETDHLVPERIWQELSRGLMEPRPDAMLDVLHQCGYLEKHLPAIASWRSVISEGLRRAAATGSEAPVEVRYGLLFWRPGDDVGAAAASTSAMLKVPGDCADLAGLVGARRDALCLASASDATTLHEFLRSIDAIRRPERLDRLLLAASLASQPVAPARSIDRIRLAAAAFRAVDAGAVVRTLGEPALAVEALRSARIEAIEKSLGEWR